MVIIVFMKSRSLWVLGIQVQPRTHNFPYNENLTRALPRSNAACHQLTGGKESMHAYMKVQGCSWKCASLKSTRFSQKKKKKGRRYLSNRVVYLVFKISPMLPNMLKTYIVLFSPQICEHAPKRWWSVVLTRFVQVPRISWIRVTKFRSVAKGEKDWWWNRSPVEGTWWALWLHLLHPEASGRIGVAPVHQGKPDLHLFTFSSNAFKIVLKFTI